MEKSWVMTESERLQMLKTRMEKKQKQRSEYGTDYKRQPRIRSHHGYRNEYEPDINFIRNHLSENEVSDKYKL